MGPQADADISLSCQRWQGRADRPTPGTIGTAVFKRRGCTEARCGRQGTDGIHGRQRNDHYAVEQHLQLCCSRHDSRSTSHKRSHNRLATET